jgi:hypothetical protein
MLNIRQEYNMWIYIYMFIITVYYIMEWWASEFEVFIHGFILG